MRTTRKQSTWHETLNGRRLGPAVSRAMVTILGCLCCCGCNEPGQVAQTTDDEAPTITLNRRDNGAAVTGGASAGSFERTAMPRSLSFEMAAFAHPGGEADAQERRAAATQAAVVNAFCDALIEARRSRGQPDADFTARLGPRLTVTHCTTADGPEVRIDLVSRGVETTFSVLNGALQHPPRDLSLLHRIFEETHGEFALLGTEWFPGTDLCIARVGYYLPAGYEEALAGDVLADPTGDAGAP